MIRGQDAAGNWGNATQLGIQVNGDATGVDALGLPASFALAQNRPNPFGAATSIRFALPAPGEVSLDVFDVTGRRVRTLFSGTGTPGKTTIDWDGLDDVFGNVDDGVRLAMGSPAINSGADLSGVISTDLEGNARPAFDAYEIGAYEFMDDAGGFRILKWSEKK